MKTHSKRYLADIQKEVGNKNIGTSSAVKPEYNEDRTAFMKLGDYEDPSVSAYKRGYEKANQEWIEKINPNWIEVTGTNQKIPLGMYMILRLKRELEENIIAYHIVKTFGPYLLPPGGWVITHYSELVTVEMIKPLISKTEELQ